MKKKKYTNNKSKAFTLVEIISVIVIMGILLIVAVPSVMGISNNIKESMYCTKTKNLESAAKLYGQDYIDELEQEVVMKVKVKDLIDNNLYKKEVNNCTYDSSTNPCVADPRDNSSMDSKTVTIVIKDKKISAYFDHKNDNEIKACEAKAEADRAGTYTVFFDSTPNSNPGTTSTTVQYGQYIPNITIPQRRWTASFRSIETNWSTRKDVNYTFLGYYTAPNDPATKYVDGSGRGVTKYNNPRNIRLYARWQTYKIEFPNATRQGYTLSGWYNGSSRVGGAGTQMELTSNLNLTAKWTANNYTITLDNDGSTTSISQQFGSAMKTVSIPTKAGQTFGGYYTGRNGTGTQYIKANGTSARNWDQANGATLYAKWTANGYTVRLDSNGATNPGTQSINVTYGSNLPNITIPIKEYKVTFNSNGGSAVNAETSRLNFQGYFLSQNGAGTKYINADGTSARTWNITANRTLYAYYNGGKIKLPSTQRSGYKFIGWYTSQSGGAYVGTSGQNYVPDSNRTLYAHWENTCKIGDAWEYNFTGGDQTFTAPCSGTYQLEVYGAEGGQDQYCIGGAGGYSTGTKSLSMNSKLHIYVGGQGFIDADSYNGGGKGCYTISNDDQCTYAVGGGGATHISTKSGTLPSYKNAANAANYVLIVAGGGGGCSDNSGYGGSGGGLNGDNGKESDYFSGRGGSQTEGYAFGQGEPTRRWQSSAGGGGWYGGYASAGEERSAGGGSGWIGGVDNGSMKNGVHTGNGYAKITLKSID